MKQILSALVLISGWTLAAAKPPEISIDRVQQRYPWNGLVDVDYTLTGIVNEAVYEIDLDVVDGAGKLYDAATFLSKPSTADGTHRLTWNAAADGARFLSKRASFKLNLREIAVARNGDYMVIDLSGGADAKTYNVSYLSGIADPTNYFNTAEYKTSRIVLKRIKAGSFWMGSPETEEGRSENEKLHYVTLTNDYYIGMFPVTWGQYKRVVGAEIPDGLREAGPLNGSIGGYKALCEEDGFLKRLNARSFNSLTQVTGFDVPTEARWEYAARAGTATAYFFGDDPALLVDYTYYNNASFTEVGMKLPSPWCLWDLYGMVREYTYDDWEEEYPDSTEENPAVEPVVYKPRYRNNLTVRGGAVWDNASRCRSASRETTTASTKSAGNGFRLSIACRGTGSVTE